ncbi:MAG: hypothetical protein Q7K35_03705 [bacterium]|nr:hypothetical protein [bacterium]
MAKTRPTPAPAAGAAAPATATPLPAPAPATPPAKPAEKKIPATDPVELQMFKSRLPVPTAVPTVGTPVTPPPEKYNIFVRVLNINDKGLGKKTIVFTCEGDQKIAVTDKQGDAVCPFNTLTAPADGKELRVSAHISGISGFSIMHVIQRVAKTPPQIAWDAKNNKWAKIFIYAAAGLWIIGLLVALFFGLGKPLIDYSQTTLSEQQSLYNALPGIKGTIMEIKPDPAPSGVWQKPFFLGVIIWTIFSVIYGAFSLREEVMEAFRQGVQNIIDRRGYSVVAKDPLLQRLMAYAGTLKSVRREIPTNTGETPATPQSPTTTTTPSHGNTFWERFLSSLSSDFTVEILPKILKAVFKL